MLVIFMLWESLDELVADFRKELAFSLASDLMIRGIIFYELVIGFFLVIGWWWC